MHSVPIPAIRALTLSLLVLAPRTILAQSPAFAPIDFPGATATHAFGINARGQIVGNYSNNGPDHGYLFSGGSYTSLDIPGASATDPYGINTRQDVIGSYAAAGVTHGFLLSGGKMTTLDYPGSASTELLGINDAGDIVGDYSLTDTTPCCATGTHGFVMSQGKFTTLDFPGASTVYTYANSIAADGSIVGAYSDGKNHGFQWKSGHFTALAYPSPSTTFMNALGINARGDIVGRYMDTTGRHAYLLSAGQLTVIDVPGAFISVATAIDPAGNILGHFRDQAGNFHGFVLKAAGPQYAVTDLGLQGPTGGPFVLLDSGLISGSAPVAGGSVHAVLWYNGLGPIDIGASAASLNSVAYAVNEQGQVAGAAETSAANQSDFCGFVAAGVSPGKTCLPFLWQNGTTAALPTLGGPNGYATAINARGDAAGLAETATTDPHSNCPVKQFKPVIWQKGAAAALATSLATSGTDAGGNSFSDSSGFVYWINDAGQTVGAAGECNPGASPNGTPLQPLHALFWDSDGSVRDMGSLGGTGHGSGIWAVHLNNRGAAVGSSDVQGDQSAHAFLWTRQTGMRDLGTLPGDQQSGALWNSDAGDVVGVSINFDGGFNPRAFLLRQGADEMIDLNSGIPANSPFYLLFAVSINSGGEILATAFNSGDNQVHSVLLTPLRGAAQEAFGAARPMFLPEHVRKAIEGKFGIRRR